MPWKDMLVCLDDETSTDNRLDFACAAAKDHNCRLRGMYRSHMADPQLYADPAIAMSAWERISKDLVDAEEAARNAFEARIAELGVAGEWVNEVGTGIEAYARVSHYSDVVILGQADPDSNVQDSETMLMSSGRPTWHVPYTSAKAGTPQRVLIGWTETRESARAVHDALPLLVRAEHVDVLSIAQNTDELKTAKNASSALTAHLEHHGISVRAHAELDRELTVADALLSRASDFQSDTIVIGAYGHSRLREWAFGGATKGLLEHMTVPVFMVH